MPHRYKNWTAWTAWRRPGTLLMALDALDPNDPQPLRDEPRFGNDYKAFRKADKAWSERERGRRKRAKVAEQAEAAVAEAAEQTVREEEPVPAQLGHPVPEAAVVASVEAPSTWAKPPGRVPLADGIPCAWDAADGCWRSQAGAVHDVAAARQERQQAYFARRAVSEAELQEQRRLDCARIDATVLDLLPRGAAMSRTIVGPDGAMRRQSGPIRDDEVVVEPSIILDYKMNYHLSEEWYTSAYQYGLGKMVTAPAADDFLRELIGIVGYQCTTHVDAFARQLSSDRALQILRSRVYWVRAHGQVAAEGCMTAEQFDYHLRELITCKVQELCSARAAQVRSYVVGLIAERDAKQREETQRRDAARDAAREVARQREAAELQASDLAQRSEPGEVLVAVRPLSVHSTPIPEYLRFLGYRWDCIPRSVLDARGNPKSTVSVRLNLDVFTRGVPAYRRSVIWDAIERHVACRKRES